MFPLKFRKVGVVLTSFFTFKLLKPKVRSESFRKYWVILEIILNSFFKFISVLLITFHVNKNYFEEKSSLMRSKNANAKIKNIQIVVLKF